MTLSYAEIRSRTEERDRSLREKVMSLDEAAAEVRNCRGTQFAPDVVDALFAAYRRRPALFEGDEQYDIAATA